MTLTNEPNVSVRKVYPHTKNELSTYVKDYRTTNRQTDATQNYTTLLYVGGEI